MKNNTAFKQIQELEQRLIALDLERNAIISQIEKLKICGVKSLQQTTKIT
jgi:hypothetical protein